jgi:zinc transporter ZupT
MSRLSVHSPHLQLPTIVLVLIPAEPGTQSQQEQNSQSPPPVHQGHSHGHQSGGGANITWMVLLGDGLHNLTDGLAIGVRGGSGEREGDPGRPGLLVIIWS